MFSGRGTFTYQDIRPKHVVNADHAIFVGIASGKRHSLLVSDRGQVYSTGDGRTEQLGAHKLGCCEVKKRSKQSYHGDSE